MQNQELAIQQWVAQQLGSPRIQMQPIVGDASFRSYYRVNPGDHSLIAMLAPPENEKTTPFVTIAKSWQSQGLPVPIIHGWDETQGFVLLSDFGDVLLKSVLTPHTVDSYYCQAMQLLLSLQNSSDPALPLYDESLIRLELSYFEEWFLNKYLNLDTKEIHKTILEPFFAELVEAFLTQPQGIVHRDFHSRNLMVLENGQLGMIDFQDAVKGPITYDLVSLLKDCYVCWPAEKVTAWVRYFAELSQLPFPQLLKGFSLVGLQRHLKVLGVFARLKLRDNKAHYLKDIPRIIDYILAVPPGSAAHQQFYHWFSEVVPCVP